MTTAPLQIIHLHRIDPSRNMARFYRVTIEKTLFDETIVRRCWGRIGTRGRSLILVIDDEVEAPSFARASDGAAIVTSVVLTEPVQVRRCKPPNEGIARRDRNWRSIVFVMLCTGRLLGGLADVAYQFGSR